MRRDFFERDALTVAEELIGCELVSRVDGAETRGAIVETEAYLGYDDSAAHCARGETRRTRALFGEKGHAYIYLIYGMYWCLNISCGSAGRPDCVLIRALEPVEGIDVMSDRRGTNRLANLCSGPGKLCMALSVTGELYGADMCDSSSPLQIVERARTRRVGRSRRVGVDYAGEAADYLYRFFDTDSACVSRR